MKRILSVVLLLALLLCGCGGQGDTQNVVYDIGSSRLYETGEIEGAMDVVEQYFRKNFSGCTLIKLSYDEAFSSRFAEKEVALYDGDDAIVLNSVFDVAEENGPVTLEPGSTHYYTWTLTRSGNGTWTLQNWGYG